MYGMLTIPSHEEGRASRAPAGMIEHTTRYPIPDGVSRAGPLAQAAEVLLLLQRPLSATCRLVFLTLLEW